MNTRIVLSAAFAASLLLAPTLAQAQAPTSPPSIIQAQQAKIASLQAQVNALQAQVKRLQAQVRASSPSGVISPFYKVPNYNIAPFQNPPLFQSPGNQGFGGQGFGRQNPLPQSLAPRIYSNIPPCSVILINQKPR